MTQVREPMMKRNFTGFLCVLIVAWMSGRFLKVFSTDIPNEEHSSRMASTISSSVLSQGSYVSEETSLTNTSRNYFLQTMPTLLAALSIGPKTNFSCTFLRASRQVGSFKTFLTCLNLTFFFSRLAFLSMAENTADFLSAKWSSATDRQTD